MTLAKLTRPAVLRVLIFTFAAMAGLAAHADPLFQSDEVIDVRIDAPFSLITRKTGRSVDPHAGVLTTGDGTAHPIMISARGKSRREFCRFPPLRVRFDPKPKAPSVFKGQKGLKLVTHCQKSKSYRQFTLLEYSAYKMLNTLTNESLRVRLANIEYVDTKSGKTVAVRQGFFIEDTDDAAKRLGKKELDIPKVKSSQLNSIDAARTELFQYMIGNLDWSIRLGPQKSDCCHNAKLIAQTKRATTDFTPVPYDFDASGLVDASHASPPQSLRVSSVRTRLYRGFCSRALAGKSKFSAAYFSCLRQKQPKRRTASEPGLQAAYATTFSVWFL